MANPDPSLLHAIVAPRVIKAMERASEALAKAGVRHLVAGGLAVVANGYARATTDAHFLVGDEAFEKHGGIVTLRPGVPFQVDDVAIDFLTVGPDEDFLRPLLNSPPGAFLEAPPLVYLKLKSPRLKDHVDVVELIKAGVNPQECRRYLEMHAPPMLARFDDLAARAETE